MKFATENDHPVYIGEKGWGLPLVEAAGYIPADIQIEQMIDAGVRLNYARAEQFDYASAEDDDGLFVDPTRRPDFDLSDASALADLASARLMEQERRWKEKVAEAQKKDAEEYAAYKASLKVKENGTT